jgi:hypothetical protein
MSHEALGKTTKSHATNPNVWFVGVTPRRNPELVVAVLWQNGQFSYYPARIGAKVVSAYVEKQRRLANNLAQPAKTESPAEMSAVWTVPNPSDPQSKGTNAQADRLESGHFLIQHGEIIAGKAPASSPITASGTPASPVASVRKVRDRQPEPGLPSVELHAGARVAGHGPQTALSVGKGQ